MSGADNGGGVRPTSITAWQLIGTAVAVMASMGIAIWTIITDQNRANEAILNELHNGYITKAQHEDLSTRLTREVARVDELARVTLPRQEFDRWKQEHDALVTELKRRMDEINAMHLPRGEFNAWREERGRTVDAMQRQIDDLTFRIRGLLGNDKRQQPN